MKKSNTQITFGDLPNGTYIKFPRLKTMVYQKNDSLIFPEVATIIADGTELGDERCMIGEGAVISNDCTIMEVINRL